MIAKILKYNGEIIYRSKYQPLIIEENADPHVQYNMHSFKQTNEECLGAKLTCGELKEVGDECVHTSTMLPCEK